MKRIRKMILSDAMRVAEVHKQAWDAAYRGILPDAILESINLEYSISVWRDDIIPQSESEHLVYEEDGLVWGFLDYGPCRDADKDPTRTQEIYAIYTSPERPRRGYGSQLFQAMLLALSSHPPEEITLWVLEANQTARRFYEEMGCTLEASSTQPLEAFGGVMEVRYVLKSVTR